MLCKQPKTPVTTLTRLIDCYCAPQDGSTITVPSPTERKQKSPTLFPRLWHREAEARLVLVCSSAAAHASTRCIMGKYVDAFPPSWYHHDGLPMPCSSANSRHNQSFAYICSILLGMRDNTLFFHRLFLIHTAELQVAGLIVGLNEGSMKRLFGLRRHLAFFAFRIPRCPQSTTGSRKEG